MTSEERTSLLSQEQDLENTDLAKNAGLVETKKILGLPASTISIIIVEFCERFAFYGSSLCFTIYMLQMLNLSYEAVDAVQNGFLTWSYLCALLGGYLGDSSFGKVKTILVFSCTYLCGLLILTASSLPLAYGEYPNRPTTILAYGGFYAALFLIGMGTGGIKSNVSVLVAEQIENPEDVERAFRYFYWSINAGALLGQLIVPFLHHHGPLMKDRFGALQGTSFWMSFLAPTLLFLIGIAVFIHGIPTYTQSTQTDKSVLIRSWNILKKAIGNRKIPTLQPCHWLDKALLHASTDPPPSVQDISLVMDLKEVFHASKIFAVFPIYWLLYNQMQTSFIQQGLQMQTPKWLTADQLNIVDPFCILLLIPFFDSVVFPFLRSRGIHLGFISRISIGFIFSGVALFYSAALQYQINQEGRFINGEYHPTVPTSQRTSLFQQIPPYALIAISEIFASVTALELSYSQAPKTMKSVVMSLFLLTNAFGSILGIFVAPFMGAENLFMAFLWLGITMVLFAIFFYFSFRNHMRTVRETPSFLQE